MGHLFVLFLLLSMSSAAYGADILKQNNFFKIAYNHDWAPYSAGKGEDVQGGIVESVNSFIENNFEMKVSNYGLPWKRVQLLVENGKMDAFVTVPTKERLKYAYSSKSIVYKIELIAITRKTIPSLDKISSIIDSTEFSKYKVCDTLGNGWGKWFHKKNKIKRHPTINLKSCLGMIQAGMMDVTIQSKYAVNELLKKNPKLKDIKTLPTVYGTMSFTLLLSKKSKFGLDFLKEFDEKFEESTKL